MRKWSPSDSSIYACVLDPTNAVLAIIPLLGEKGSLEGEPDCAMSALVTPISHILQRPRCAFQTGARCEGMQVSV